MQNSSSQNWERPPYSNQTLYATDNYETYVQIWVQDLIKMVEEEIRLFQSFLDILTSQQQSIANGDLAEILNSKQRAEEIVYKTQNLKKIKDATLAQNPIGDRSISSVEQVIPLVESYYGTRLAELRETLLTTIKKVKYASKASRHLLSKSLNFVERHIELYNSRQSGAKQYGNDGKTKSEKHTLILEKVC